MSKFLYLKCHITNKKQLYLHTLIINRPLGCKSRILLQIFVSFADLLDYFVFLQKRTPMIVEIKLQLP